jgi:hypothetical protein
LDEPLTDCHTSYREKCESEAAVAEEICQEEYVDECHPVPEQKCATEYETVCRQVPYEKCATTHEVKCAVTHEEVKSYKTENNCYWPQESNYKDEPCY